MIDSLILDLGIACQEPVGAGAESCTRYASQQYNLAGDGDKLDHIHVSLHVAPDGTTLSAYVVQSLKESVNVERL
jgi:hypothetical protein